MPAANVVRGWQDGQYAYLAVAVQEPGENATREYIGKVAMSDLQGLTSAQTKTALVAAAKAERARSVALTQIPAVTDLGINGQVTI